MKKNIFPATFWQAIIFLLFSLILSAPFILITQKLNIINDIFENIFFIIFFLMAHLIYFFRNKKLPIYTLKLDKIIIPFIISLFFFMIGIMAPITFYIKSKVNHQVEFSEFSYYLLFSTLILAPIIEELIFRGIILKNFISTYTKFKAILFSTTIFTLIHMNIVQFLAAFFLGLLVGVVFYYSKSVGMTIILHFTANLTAIISIFIHQKQGNFNVLKFSDIYGSNTFYIILGSITLLTGFLLYFIKNKEIIVMRLKRISYS